MNPVTATISFAIAVITLAATNSRRSTTGTSGGLGLRLRFTG
jgi:hypothetical protein